MPVCCCRLTLAACKAPYAASDRCTWPGRPWDSMREALWGGRTTRCRGEGHQNGTRRLLARKRQVARAQRRWLGRNATTFPGAHA